MPTFVSYGVYLIEHNRSSLNIIYFIPFLMAVSVVNLSNQVFFSWYFCKLNVLFRFQILCRKCYGHIILKYWFNLKWGFQLWFCAFRVFVLTLLNTVQLYHISYFIQIYLGNLFNSPGLRFLYVNTLKMLMIFDSCSLWGSRLVSKNWLRLTPYH